MNRILFLCLVALLSLGASAQTYIKTNALYWAALLPNVQVETRIANNVTFQGEVNASFWESVNSRPYKGAQFIVGSRWYPKEEFRGFYVGGDVSFDIYEVSKWDHPIRPGGGVDVQHGIGCYLGVTLGYQISIGKRWNMDFYAGGGWHLGSYWGDTQYPDGTNVIYARWNQSGEWIPYKLGVAFGFRL